MPDEDELSSDRTEFRPGWPAFYPHGLIVARSSVTQLDAEDEVDSSDEREPEWTLHIGLRDETPRLALLGDLIVRSPFAFAGVTVILPFELRDEPAEFTTSDLDGILKQYGEWASSVMYDHAATVMRTAVAGNGLPIFVPVGTPEANLHTTGDDAS